MRNRRTGERFDEAGKVIKVGFFERKYEAAEEGTHIFIKDIEKRLSDWPEIKKNGVIRELYKEIQKHKVDINKFLSDSEKMEQLKGLLKNKESKSDSSSKKMPNSLDFLKNIVKMALASQFPMAAFTLAMLPLA